VVATLESGVKHTPTLFFCAVVLSWRGVAGSLRWSAFRDRVDYYFIPPIYALGISLEEAPDMIAFVASALFVSWLSGEQKRAKDSRREARDNLNARALEGTPKLGQTEDQLQVGTPRRRTAEKGLMQAHAEVARVARITNMGELAAPIADELGEVEEFGHEVEGRTPAPEKLEAVLFDGAREFLAHPSTLCPQEESVFFRQGDYWTIRYRGQVARLKATRGLDCLASLLGHPGQEFHVSELVAAVGEVPVPAPKPTGFDNRDDGSYARASMLASNMSDSKSLKCGCGLWPERSLEESGLWRFHSKPRLKKENDRIPRRPVLLMPTPHV
jgi:hypothetical protein